MVTEQRPDPNARLKLAGEHYKGGRLQDAATLYQRLIDEIPESIQAWAGLGMARHDLGDLQAARGAFRKLTTLAPQLPGAHIVLAGVQRQLGQLSDAEASLEQALKLDQRNPGALANRGLIALERGDLAKAISDLQAARDVDPDNIQAMIALPGLSKIRRGDPFFAKLEALSRSESITRRDHARIHYTLGKIYADIEAYAESFANYHQANTLQYIEDRFQDRCFDPRHLKDATERLIAAPLPGPAGKGAPAAPAPVFILGLPRSGKSLLEGLLAAHPACTPLGESDLFHRRAKARGLLPLGDGVPDPELCAAWARDVRADLTAVGDTPWLLNTLPEAIDLLPLVAWSFPEAKIIFCDRHPLDLSLSAFFKDLRPTHNYANDLGDMAKVFRAHADRVAHFEAAASLETCRISYEDLVRNPEATLQGVLRFLGLDFHEDCRPEVGQGIEIDQVGPARSLDGYRQIYTGYIDFWRNYEPFIRPLIAALDPTPGSHETYRNRIGDATASISAKLDLAHFEAQAGDLDAALSLCREAAEAAPDDPRPRMTRGDLCAAAGDEAGAADAYWDALSIRPYSLEMPRVYTEFQRCLMSSDPALAELHRSIGDEFRADRQAFGDFGLLYQAFEPLRLPGHRPTRSRFETYRLAELLNAESRVLDIGCNAGFLSLLCAERAAAVDAFDIEKPLVRIGERVQRHLGLDNVDFSAGDFHEFQPSGRYDLIFSFAVHHWIGMPLPDYAARLHDWLNPGGAIVFESQGRRSVTVLEEDLDAKIDCLLKTGMEKLWDGELVDDGVNRRYFAVLRRVG